MPISMTEILKATRLTRQGNLMDATRLIQRALGRTSSPPPTPKSRPPAGPSGADSMPVIDVTIEQEPVQQLDAPPRDISARAAEPSRSTVPAREASFTEHTFNYADKRYLYRLYVPGIAADDTNVPGRLPLVVMLHGCKQDAADFARGTAMNDLAAQKKCIVLYPEQLVKSNGMHCWNWFDTGHQKRDAGEPGMIAALTREIVASRDADPSRVYIAGLSAGAAMAAVVAGLYPEQFAAVGVHSGLPPGAARDVMSAFSAMRSGSRGTRGTRGARGAQGVQGGQGGQGARGAQGAQVGGARAAAAKKIRAVPTIVFHGSADSTVHPDNGDDVVSVALAAMNASGVQLDTIQLGDDAADNSGKKFGRGRKAVRTIHRTADGKPQVEHWAIASGPHAWSGGDKAGSYTDPDGPDASRAMLEFFLQHKV